MNAFIAHHIRILRHRAQEMSVCDQSLDRIGFIKAYAHDVGAAGCLDRITCSCCTSFVTAEDTYYFLCDVVLRDLLGFRRGRGDGRGGNLHVPQHKG